MAIHLASQAQIALLKAEKALAIVPEEYSDYTNVFPKNWP